MSYIGTILAYSIIAVVVVGIGMYGDYTHTIEINADTQDTPWIKDIINNTDSNLTKKINSISIVNQSVVGSLCESLAISSVDGSLWWGSVGCTVSNIAGSTFLDADIYIADKPAFEGMSTTQQFTLYHEIGHVYNMYYGIRDTERDADNYAEVHIRNPNLHSNS